MKTLGYPFYMALAISLSCPGLWAGEDEESKSSEQPVKLSTLKLGEKVQYLDDQDMIRVEAPAGGNPQNIHLFDIEQPDITRNAYALSGEVRYEKVAGKSYLETWNHFVTGKGPAQFFTRSLNNTGPLGILTNNSDWRPFQLPFFINSDDASLKGPNKITFNLHLDGGGLVEIRNVKLVDGLEHAMSPQDAFRNFVGPNPLLVLLSVLLTVAIPLIAVFVVFYLMHRRKRTADELRRIQASDV